MHRPIKAVKAQLPWKQNGQIKKVWLSLCMQVWMQKIRYHSLNFDKLTDIKYSVDIKSIALMVQYAVRREERKKERDRDRERQRKRQERETETKKDKKRQRDIKEKRKR